MKCIKYTHPPLDTQTKKETMTLTLNFEEYFYLFVYSIECRCVYAAFHLKNFHQFPYN